MFHLRDSSKILLPLQSKIVHKEMINNRIRTISNRLLHNRQIVQILVHLKSFHNRGTSDLKVQFTLLRRGVNTKIKHCFDQTIRNFVKMIVGNVTPGGGRGVVVQCLDIGVLLGV